MSTDYRWHYFHYFYKDIECQTFSLLADYVIHYVLTIEILYISKISMIFLCDKSGVIGKKVNAQRDIDYGICLSSSLWKILTSIYIARKIYKSDLSMRWISSNNVCFFFFASSINCTIYFIFRLYNIDEMNKRDNALLLCKWRMYH